MSKSSGGDGAQSPSVLKLGTRKSLLAWAQSGWVAREVERLNPGVRVELVGIETQGDRILDVSLQKMEGKEFFVAELDYALGEGRVDFTVHSMKDLSLERPAKFVLAAIPRRENQRDVVLFGPRALEKIREGRVLQIGTSSPRRLENIPSFLERALPQVAPEGGVPRLKFVEIRGNVNSRLARVHEPDGSARQLDAVVLAFAGLIRLWADEAGRQELAALLRGVRWMVLPLRENPTAPAQGALAVECRASDHRVRERLGRLHDVETERHVTVERGLLAEWGGGCHQKFGASSMPAAGIGDLFYIRGVKPEGGFVEKVEWHGKPEAPETHPIVPWDGTTWRSAQETTRIELGAADLSRPAFVSHWRAVPEEWTDRLGEARLWTSGVASWRQLAKRGLWVEGCAESLGFEHLSPILGERVLQLPAFGEWNVLTHETAAADWKSAHPLATYRVPVGYSDEARAALTRATHVFWSSGSQYEQLRALVPSGAHHACGPGKTAARLQGAGIEPTLFPSAEEWRKWLS
ncbi:MAG: hydroxymethylbilane synthase [Oligoflexia bacterium]|nr:hydroxymethylbilane synthase [Oligoflexia bacterium]